MMRKGAISCGRMVQTYTEEEDNRVGEARQTDAEEEGNQSAEEKGNKMLKKRASRVLRKRATMVAQMLRKEATRC